MKYKKIILKDWLEKVTKNKEALKVIENSEDRIVRAYKELLSGYEKDPSKILNVTKEVNGYGGLVIQKDINFYSICGHHFLPFYGKISLAYEPGKIIVGIGKLKRLTDTFSRRFQIQEDLVKNIAEELMNSGKAKGSYVYSEATHNCVCSRGPNDDTTKTIAIYSCGSLKGLEKKTMISNLFSK